MINKGGAVLIVSIKVLRLVTREGIRVRIRKIKQGVGGLSQKRVSG